jgi:tetratricopeptide (TPR) repeat protein
MLALVFLFAGCQAFPARAQETDPIIPPGLDPLAVHPYTGDQLKKAGKALDEIITSIKQPSYLPQDPLALQKKLDAIPDVEPPLAAQLAYIQARMAWDQKRLFEARQYLERALTMAPNSEHLLEMLAQLWGAAGNHSRSSTYLEKVVQVDPLNMDLMLQLGAFALDQERFNDAIAIFHYVQQHLADAQTPDPGLSPLVDYYLGAALDREGYAAAAIESYRRFLTSDVQQPPHDAREARRMELLAGQQGLLWRQIGDTFCQLQQYVKALEAYRTAVTAGVGSKLDIIRRLVYVCLKIDRPELAAQSAMQALEDGKLNAQVVDLIRFVADHVPNRQQWITDIQTQLKKQASDSQAVMLMVDLFSPEVAGQMVTTHLKANPADQHAIQWMLDHQAINDSDTGLAQAVNVILTAMVAKPQNADMFSAMLVSMIDDQARLQKQIGQLPDDANTKALRLFLLAQSYARSSDLPKCQKLLEEAITLDDQLTVARLRLAVLHISLKQFDEAQKVLQPVKDPSDPRVVNIRVRLLSQADRLDDALVVLDKALELRPEDVDMILQKAQLQIRMHKVAMAERTLLDALNVNPMAEPIYDALFEMYDQGAVPDAMDQYKRLMMRVLKTIPRSRVARMRFADALSAGGENDRAENLLKELLTENPQDYRALSELLDLYRHAQMTDKADKLLDERITAAPDDTNLLLLAQSHYQQTGQIAKSVTLMETFWNKEDLDKQTGLSLVSMLSDEYVTLGRLDALDKLFEVAVKRYPDLESDLMFIWSQKLDKLDKHDRSEKLMLKLLAKHPDHAAANNGLGYVWANRGQNLQQALEMISKAVKADPGNAAYLDSLGWVHYKLGQFDKAVDYLKQAQAAPGGDYPVILDHLGDALYRKGEKVEAIGNWQRAQQRMNQPDADPQADPEIKGLDVRLKAKITAATEEKDPPLAGLGDEKQP